MAVRSIHERCTAGCRLWRKRPVFPGRLSGLCVVVVLPLLAGCAPPGLEITALPARIDYNCANNRVLSVARAPDQRSAAVLVEGREVSLARADSAAQEKYSDGNHSLYLDGERAMLESDGSVLYGPCVSPVPLPTTYRTRDY